MFTKMLVLGYIFLLYVSVVVFQIQVEGRKNVYQKDVSEFCRRRVLPSVFLSRHVMDAHAQMLHFSQLEVPYSCFLSIRAESGSNIILVIQLPIEERLDKSCDINQNQLLVYEMGETFGGYWGPIPDDIAMVDRHDTSITPSTERYYTLKTTTPYTKTTVSDSNRDFDIETEKNKTLTTPVTTQPPSPNTDENYVQMEIPLVDVSGTLVKSNSDVPFVNSFDMDDTFDLIYNVQSKPGEKYETSELPLVQFSVDQSRGSRRKGDDEENHEERFNFQIDYGVEGITQDPRLAIPDLLGLLSSKKQHTNKYKYDSNKILVFSKHKNTKRTTRRTSEDITKMIHFANNTIPSYFSEDEGDNISVSLQHVDELLNMLKVKNKFRSEDMLQLKNTSSLLQKIANVQHNSSVYLASNLSDFLVDKETENKNNNMGSKDSSTIIISPNLSTIHETSKHSEDTHSIREQSDFSKETTQHMSPEATSEKVIFDKKHIVPIISTDTSDIKEPILYQQSKTTMTAKTNAPLTPTSLISMVDHKSWENVVQAVPILFGVLNNTDSKQKLQPNMANKRLIREKRKIKSIQIKKSMPHHLSTEEAVASTSDSMYLFSDIQDFAQLVELPDDELYGHVAMRYLAKYVGSTLFNICEFRDHRRHVHLLNSSRIIISINQFTMKRMTLVATPARTLLVPDARCPSDHIECQVSGARVCIDSMTACDGVPNCGSLDIYDEDRLACGALVGLKHNVYLTAFTFLAVLVTMLYIGHYWIKRCVPKVSKAFFVYRNGCENILYMDTIMRSPSTEREGISSELLFEGAILSDEDITIKGVKKKKQSIFHRVCSLFRPKKSELETQTLQLDRLDPDSRRCYSFTEEELQKILTRSWGTADACVQTGESLDVQRQFSGSASRKKSIDIRQRIAVEKKPSVHGQSFKTVHNTALAPKEHQPNIFSIPSEKGRIRSFSKLPTVVPIKGSLEPTDSQSSRRSSINSELNVLKFFRDIRSASISFNQNDKTSPFYSMRNVDKQDIGTDYEKEIGMIEYGSPPQSHDYSQPGPSAQVDMAKKRLRFDDMSKVSGDNDNDNAGPSTASEGLGGIDDEYIEHKGLTEFKRFWGNKFGNKSTKGKSPPRRPSHY